ncbi:hypothetical protein ACWC5I_03240 [Kitasatospora sp. NPDC001574]
MPSALGRGGEAAGAESAASAGWHGLGILGVRLQERGALDREQPGPATGRQGGDAGGVPDLAMGERIALTAACALAAAMPSSVLGNLERDLRTLAATMEAAATTGLEAATGSPK